MRLTEAAAKEIAHLLNTQNRLTRKYTSVQILQDQGNYIAKYDDQGRVLGAVEVKKVQWYQCEIDHLSVGRKRQGIGSWLLEKAEARARELGARIVQGTIRVGNRESEGLFKKHAYVSTVTFLNEQNGNKVRTYQKVLGSKATRLATRQPRTPRRQTDLLVSSLDR